MTQDTIGRITADTTIDYGNLMRRRIRKVLLIGNVIEQEFMQGTNWNLGSGLSVVLMIFVIASMALMNIFDKDGGGAAVW